MKRALSALLTLLILLTMAAEPALAASKPVEVSLPEGLTQISTRHIQELQVTLKNQQYQPRDVRLVMALMDYKGNTLSRVVSQLRLKENGSANAAGHLKILNKSYEVRIYAEDTNGKLLSSTLRLPVVGGYSVKEIATVEDIRATVPQWSTFTLPEMVEATMYTGEKEYVAVKWNGKPDMTCPGTYRIRGTIADSEVSPLLTVTVLAADQITGISVMNVTVEQGARFTMPVAVKASFRSGRTDFIPVAWSKVADTSKTGTFTYTGTAAGGKTATLKLTVTAKNDSAVPSFHNADIADIAAEALNCSASQLTRGKLKTITEMDLSYTGYDSTSLEDLRWFTGLKKLDLSISGYDDLTPLADLPLTELNLYGCQNLHSIAPITPLSTLTSLKLNASGVTDYSPSAPWYDKLTTKDFTLTLLTANADGYIELTVPAGKSYDMPFLIRLADGRYDRMDWSIQTIPPQEEGSVVVTGTAMTTNRKITVECSISDRADYAIAWKDAAVEKAVRKAVDKPYGTVYYSDVKYLKELDCFALGVRTLEDLEHMRNLTYLGAAANYLDDSQWQYLKHLTKLEYLDLAMNQFTVIPSGIFDNMSQLKELCVDENNIIRIEKGAFFGLANMENLLLEENLNLKDISEAKNITHLRALLIRDTQVSDLSFLKNANDLEELWADNCPISDISFLKGKTKLYWITLENKKNQGKITDISPLADGKGLYWLALNGNQISDISALSGMTALMHLEAENNQIFDLSPLSQCKSLERAFLKNNRISDVTPLSKLVKINSLYLQNNRITDISSLSSLTRLKNLYLSGNKISDYSALKELYPQLIGKDFVL